MKVAELQRSHFEVPRRPLFHYTSAQGLMGILESRSLWMTDVRFMNDFSELQYAEQLLGNVIEARLRLTTTDPPNREFLQRYQRSLSSRLIGRAIYSVSFCDDKDLLSQWRCYRGDGGGYAIGFDHSHLVEIFEEPVALAKMSYDEAAQVHLLNAAFDTWEPVFSCFARDVPPYSMKFGTLVQTFQEALLPLMLTFKHPGFREEKEWRIFRLAVNDPRWHSEANELKFRAFSGNVVPYRVNSFGRGIEASLDHTTGRGFPIAEVVIGPTVGAELNEDSVTTLLRRLNPLVPHRVSHSDIPLRWL